MPTPEYSDLIPSGRRRIYLRDERLRALGYASYEAYLRSGAWKAAKARCSATGLSSKCVICDDAERVHMHHKTYERVGDELPADLVALCRDCHEMLHHLERQGFVGLDFTGFGDKAGEHGRARLEALVASRVGSVTDYRDDVRSVLAALPLDERIRRAKAHASIWHVSLKSPLYMLRGAMIGGRRDRILNRVEHLENVAYGWFR